MIRGLLTFFTLVSVIFFPWPLTALLAIIVSFTEPLVPLSAGLLFDTLYYAPHAGSFLSFTLWGAVFSGAAFFVRSRLRANPVRDFL